MKPTGDQEIDELIADLLEDARVTPYEKQAKMLRLAAEKLHDYEQFMQFINETYGHV